jgi:hypothetical protein
MGKLCKGGRRILGYVPIQILNLSLEEVELPKHMYVGLASPTEPCVAGSQGIDNAVNTVTIGNGDKGQSEIVFELYLNEKLGHLTAQDRNKLEPVLRKYNHIFYQKGSSGIGCTGVVKHKINTGDVQPIKRTQYRTPHASKPVVEEHIEDML